MVKISIDYSLFAYPKNTRIKNKKVLKNKQGMCKLCGKCGQTEKHHIKSKGSGGDDSEENLIEVCRMCHTKIHTGEIRKKDILKMKNM